MTTNDTILQTRHLSRIVGPPGHRTRIINDFSYSFQQYGIYIILGPSGAGKSTLLRLFNRLDEPSVGEIIFDGKDYRENNACSLRSRIGFLFQIPHMFDGTVADNLRFAREELTNEQIVGLLSACGVSIDHIEQNAGSLSVGEMQRVALARLLVTEPRVILLDEPTAALDPTYTKLVEKTILKLAQKRGLTVIMVSHQPEQAARMGGEGLLLVKGRLVESGPTVELVNHPTTEFGRRYRDRELT